MMIDDADELTDETKGLLQEFGAEFKREFRELATRYGITDFALGVVMPVDELVETHGEPTPHGSKMTTVIVSAECLGCFSTMSASLQAGVGVGLKKLLNRFRPAKRGRSAAWSNQEATA